MGFLSWSDLLFFVSATMILLVIPGPAVIYIVARSIELGTRAGIISAMGISLGGTLHVVGAALGVSAILAASAQAFMILKYLGVIYLLYLGYRTLKEPMGDLDEVKVEREGYRKIFWQGFLVEALNPKAAMFFVAFLPQFTDPFYGSVSLQIFILGAIFLLLALVSDFTYVALSGKFRQAFLKSRKLQRAKKNLSGLSYLGLGILTIFSDK